MSKTTKGLAGSITMVFAAAALMSGSAGFIRVPSRATKPVTITWWSWTTNAKNEVTAFEKTHPNIRVDYTATASSNEYSKLSVALSSHKGIPDVVQIEDDYVPQFIETGGLANITPLIQAYRKDFPAWLWGSDTLQDKVYAVPEDIGPEGLVYRPAVFAQYHLATPTTWAIYADDAIKLHKENPKMYLTFFPINEENQVTAFFWQAGVKLFQNTKAGWKINFTSAAAEKVASYWGSLIKSGAVPTADAYEPAWGHQMAKGTYASLVTAAWGPTYEIAPYTSSHSWKAMLMPQWSADGHASSNDGGSSNAITVQAAKSKVEKAAVTFATWINTSSQGITLDELPPSKGGRGLFPGDVNAPKTADFNAPIPVLDGQKANASVFETSAKDVLPGFQFSPWSAYVYDEMESEFTKAAAGTETWDQALQAIQQSVVHYAEAQGYKVVS